MQLVGPIIFAVFVLVCGALGALGISWLIVEGFCFVLPHAINFIHHKLKLPLYGAPAPRLRVSKERPEWNPLPPRYEESYSKAFAPAPVPFTHEALTPAPEKQVGGTVVHIHARTCPGCKKERKLFRGPVCVKCSAEHEATAL